MNHERIINILESLPKQILIHCAEMLIKKKEALAIKSNKPKIRKKMTSGQTNVMLAHPYLQDKHSAKVSDWWMSEKYDGVRAKWNGAEMESRTGLIYTLPDFLTEQLLSITDENGDQMELDGELWAGIDTFALMSGLARRHDNDPELWEQVSYMIFDTPNTLIPFEDRIRSVGAALKRAGNPPNIKGIKHIKFNQSEMDIDEELKKIENKGGEGLVLRKPGSMYEFKRSQNMLKVKSWSLKEAVVTGYEAGKEGVSGKMLGLVGSLLVKSDEFGDENETERKWVNFKVGSGLNDWQRYTGNMKEELSGVKKWNTVLQNKVDILRKKMIKPIDKDSEIYQNIIKTIDNGSGKERTDALHQLNTLFIQMPVIGDIITFRFKELTKDGNPSMPTFVTVRNYE